MSDNTFRYKPSGESIILIMAFNTWLNKEYKHYDEHDFASKGEYNSWLRSLFQAYRAGVEFEQVAFRAGM